MITGSNAKNSRIVFDVIVKFVIKCYEAFGKFENSEGTEANLKLLFIWTILMRWISLTRWHNLYLDICFNLSICNLWYDLNEEIYLLWIRLIIRSKLARTQKLYIYLIISRIWLRTHQTEVEKEIVSPINNGECLNNNKFNGPFLIPSRCCKLSFSEGYISLNNSKSHNFKYLHFTLQFQFTINIFIC